MKKWDELALKERLLLSGQQIKSRLDSYFFLVDEETEYVPVSNYVFIGSCILIATFLTALSMFATFFN